MPNHKEQQNVKLYANAMQTARLWIENALADWCIDPQDEGFRRELERAMTSYTTARVEYLAARSRELAA